MLTGIRCFVAAALVCFVVTTGCKSGRDSLEAARVEQEALRIQVEAAEKLDEREAKLRELVAQLGVRSDELDVREVAIERREEELESRDNGLKFRELELQSKAESADATLRKNEAAVERLAKADQQLEKRVELAKSRMPFLEELAVDTADLMSRAVVPHIKGDVASVHMSRKREFLRQSLRAELRKADVLLIKSEDEFDALCRRVAERFVTQYVPVNSYHDREDALEKLASWQPGS
jgi:DNA repair exonuclease SbcCD ATPase subunit